MPKGAGEAKAEETKRKSVLGKHGAHFRVQEIPPYKPHPIIGFLCAGSPEMNEKLNFIFPMLDLCVMEYHRDDACRERITNDMIEVLTNKDGKGPGRLWIAKEGNPNFNTIYPKIIKSRYDIEKEEDCEALLGFYVTAEGFIDTLYEAYGEKKVISEFGKALHRKFPLPTEEEQTILFAKTKTLDTLPRILKAAYGEEAIEEAMKKFTQKMQTMRV